VLINDYQQRRFGNMMLAAMFNTVAGKRIALFGAAFKANTGDTRESPALNVCRELLDERAELVITDPYALDNARADLGAAAERVQFGRACHRRVDRVAALCRAGLCGDLP